MRVTANGVDFHVQQIGSGGETVVMIHGMVMDNLSSLFYTLANPVAHEVGAQVMLYDLRGHGLSSRPDHGYRIADSVADLVGLLDELEVDGPVHLLGNSYGGTVALATAAAHPERVAGLVIVEGHFAVAGWGDHMAESLELAGWGLFDQDLVGWLQQHGTRKLDRMYRNADALIWHTSLLDDMRASPPFGRAELASISCPVLAVYGEHSDVIDRAHDLDELVPHSDVRIMEGCSHSVLMERTAEVRALVIDWLAASADRHPAEV